MSEALLDEVEAINSIYGAATLVPALAPASASASAPEQDTDPSHDPDAVYYILALPSGDDNDNDNGDDKTSSGTSLRLQFPSTYPDAPPAVVGTHGAAGRRRGEAARDLALFRDAVAAVYEPGQVCLFDAIEKRREVVEAALADGGEEEDNGGEEDADQEGEEIVDTSTRSTLASGAKPALLGGAGEEEPPWILSDPVTELKSTFLARCARVTSPAQAAAFVQHLLASDRRVRAATHNITAWRIRGTPIPTPTTTAGGVGTVYQDCDDDGETAAGGRVLHLMQLMDLWDVVVVVTRWYGGHKLGPRRFALINTVARDAFVKAGLVADGESSSSSGKKKGGAHGR